MQDEKIIVTTEEMTSMLERLTFQIVESSPNLSELCIMGIRRRGVNVAERILSNLNKYNKTGVEFGTLDITLYRDDLSEIASMPQLKSSDIQFNLANKTVVLVDDVLFTGRTIRAAMEAVLDYGRPKKILLAVLIDRGHRELPIEANFVGKVVQTAMREVIHVKVKEIDGCEDMVTISVR